VDERSKNKSQKKTMMEEGSERCYLAGFEEGGGHKPRKVSGLRSGEKTLTASRKEYSPTYSLTVALWSHVRLLTCKAITS
jgi:hypothetical protein